MCTGCHYLCSLSVCLCVSVTLVVFTDCGSYEADFHQPGIYESGRVWANAGDVFLRQPSRGGRGRRAAVDIFCCVLFSVCLDFVFFFFRFFFFQLTRLAASMRPPLTSCTPQLVVRQSRGSEATESAFILQAKKPPHPRVRAGCHYLIGMSVYM